MWSLLNEPRCSIINNVNVPEISNHPNGKMKDLKYEIDRTVPDQNKYKYYKTQYYFNKVIFLTTYICDR